MNGSEVSLRWFSVGKKSVDELVASLPVLNEEHLFQSGA